MEEGLSSSRYIKGGAFAVPHTFRFSDGDPFPIACSKCEEKLVKTVGEMKRDLNTTCPHCGRRHWFHAETFSRSLQEIEDSINGFRGKMRAS